MNDRIIRAAFIISLVGHGFLLGIPGPRFTYEVPAPEETVVRVEIEKALLLPKIEVLGKEKKIEGVAEEEKKDPRISPENRLGEAIKREQEERIEATSPAEEAMLRYQDMVRQRIEEARRYPPWAKQREIKGIVYLSFTALPDGSSRDIKITRSSSYRILDEEAIATVRRANPFPSFPEEILSPAILIKVSLVFVLE